MTKNRYSRSLKDEVIKFHKEHGNAKTFEKYPEIPAGTWYCWVNKGAPKKNRYYPTELKEEIVAYYRKNGTVKTSQKYSGIPASTFHSWANGRNMGTGKIVIPTTLFKDEVDTHYKKNGREPIYQKLEIPEPKPVPEPIKQEVKEKQKIYVVVSEDADEIIKVLKGLK